MGNFPQPSQALRVIASNSCGSSLSRALSTITISDCNRLSDPESTLLVYPNPAVDFISVELVDDASLVKRVSLWDMAGRLVNSSTNFPNQSDKLIFSVLGVPAGIYMLQVETDKTQELVRLTVQ